MFKAEFSFRRVRTRPDIQAPKTDLPWLNRHGQILSDGKLKKVSKNWSYGTWQRFLDWLEVPLAEVLLPPSLYDYLSESLQTSVFDSFGTDSEDISLPDLSLLMRQLTKKQRHVIKMIFWEGLTERQVALRLKISRGTVRDLKHRAMKRLRKIRKFPSAAPNAI